MNGLVEMLGSDQWAAYLNSIPADAWLITSSGKRQPLFSVEVLHQVHEPISRFHEGAPVRPRFEKNIPNNQQPLQREDRSTPIRSVRQIIPAEKRIADIENEPTESLRLANDAPTVYDSSKSAPPSDRLGKLRAKVQDLSQKLRQAQDELETEENLPTALEVFVSNALQLEQKVQFLAGRLLTALVDLDLRNLAKAILEQSGETTTPDKSSGSKNKFSSGELNQYGWNSAKFEAIN